MKKQMKPIAVASLALALLIISLGAVAQEADTRLNKAIALLENDEPAFGLLSFDYSLNNARSLSRSGLDFIIIDMEHAPFDVERIREFLLGMTDKRAILEKGNLQPNVVPFVRIPASGGEDVLSQVKQALDVGAFGVMFPSVNNAAEAEMAIRARGIHSSMARMTMSLPGCVDATRRTQSGIGGQGTTMRRQTCGP